MFKNSPELHSIEATELVTLPNHLDVNGGLVVIEGMVNVPFQISRVFTVVAPAGAVRGQHAHRNCAQFLICAAGNIEVLCDDGLGTKNYILDRPEIGLYIPYSIWAKQTYVTENAVLIVLCNHPYNAQDYIRDYQQFKNYRK